jgi:hypothetical protein
MSNDLMTEHEAAEYCGLDPKYFRNLRRTGHGPSFVRPSPHMTLYFRTSLEAWKSSWAQRAITAREQSRAED